MTDQTKSKSRIKHAALSVASVIALTTGLAATPAMAQTQQARDITIEPMPIADAVNAIADQSGTQIVLYSNDVNGLTAPALDGSYTAEQALDTILHGTDLQYRRVNARTIAVGPASRFESVEVGNETIEAGASLGEETTPKPFRMAQLDQEESIQEVDQRSPEDAEDRRDVIVVTGTLLSGVNPTSPVTVFDREDIDAGGFTSTQDFLRALPQNFDQGQNTAAGRAGDTGGAPLGSSPVNLRGLGTRSTLVLINGKRIAPGAGGSQFVDVNLIPLSAIERIEVLTDGASATYGTDAVAGVINLILKDDFEGSETKARFGAVTEGSSQQYALSQTLGTKWESGSVLGSFEYFRQNNLDSSEREFTEGGADPVDLIPKRESYSGFMQFRQRINENLSFFVDGLFSQSESTSNLQFDAGPLSGPGLFLFVDNGVDQYNINGGLDISLSAEWSAEVYGTFSRNEGDFFQSRNGVSSTATSTSDVSLIEANLDGKLASLPGGAVRLAVGAQYRNEDFIIDIANADTPPIVTDAERGVYSIFAELFIPVFGEKNRRAGIHSLDFSISGRFEDYSDFGSTSNPKFGILYSPIPNLNIRGTYGTSFIVPSYQQLFLPVNATALPGFISPLPDGSPGPDYLAVGGGNSDLSPEEAETWTIGFDFEPSFIDGLRINGTYYNIDFTDGIRSPLNGSISTIFTNPNTIDDRFIRFDPPASEVEAFFAEPFFQVFGDVTAADIGAILDNRIQNIATTSTDGLDISVEYGLPLGQGQLNFAVNGNYILSFDQRATPTSDIIETINNFAQPVDFRLRSSVGWSSEQFSSTLFLNYVDDYGSDRVGNRVPVESWTTLDYSAQYSFSEEASNDFLSGVRLSLNVQNVFNEDPPFVDSGTKGIFYDGNNASPLGRFVSVELSKSF